jgi:hypothetical protein
MQIYEQSIFLSYELVLEGTGDLTVLTELQQVHSPTMNTILIHFYLLSVSKPISLITYSSYPVTSLKVIQLNTHRNAKLLKIEQIAAYIGYQTPLLLSSSR